MSQRLQPTTTSVIHPNVQPNFGGPSIRQLKFIDRYFETGNATESARYAGYAGDDEALATQGYQVLRSPKVRLEIQRRLGTAIASSGEVLEKLTKHARADLTDVLASDGSFSFAKAKAKRILKRLKTKKTIRRTKDGEKIEDITHEYEIHDPQSALEKLGRFHGLFVERTESLNVNINLERQDISSFLASSLSDVIDITSTTPGSE